MSTVVPAYRVQPWEISPEEEPCLSEADATFHWLCSLSRDDIRPYLGQWIAARDCQVIASAVSFDALLRKLIDIDLRTVIVHRFEKPGRVVYR
jgi:hypothetical protein